MRTLRVGDKVKALTNRYGYTSIDNQWVGIVTSIYNTDNGTTYFSGDTITSVENIDEGIFDDLLPEYFKIIKQDIKWKEELKWVTTLQYLPMFIMEY